MCVYVKLAKSVLRDGHKMEKTSFLCVWFIFSANYCSRFPPDILWLEFFFMYHQSQHVFWTWSIT